MVDETKLQELAEKRGMTVEDVETLFEAELNLTREYLPSDAEESRVEELTFARMQAAEVVEKRTKGGQSNEAYPVFAIGHSGELRWNKKDSDGNNTGEKKSVVVGLGVAAPITRGDTERKPGLVAFVADETVGMDLGVVRQAFSLGNFVSVNGSIYEAKGYEGAEIPKYQGWSSDTSTVEVIGPDFEAPNEAFAESFADLPTTVDEALQMYVPTTVKHSEVMNNLSSDKFGAYLGLESVRMEVQVVDAYRDFTKDFGKYTVIDESLGGIEGYEEGAFANDKARVPGLQAFIAPEFVTMGANSRTELVGTLSLSDAGRLSFNAVAAHGIVPFAYEEPERRQTTATAPKTIGGE